MLRERTDPAFSHAFKHIAQLALLGIALAGLTACGGGGGSSTPAEKTPVTPTPTPDPAPTPTPTPTPLPECPQGQVRGDDGQCRMPAEMTITPIPGGDSIAEATDITDKETIEGQLDSADDVDYFYIRVDEPTDVTLWMDNPDVGFQVLDSEGNELVTSLQNSGGGSSSGLVAASAATPQAAPALLCLTPAGAVTCARIVVTVGRVVVRVYARRHAITRATKYVLRQAKRTGVKAVRVTQRFVKKNLEVGKAEDIDLDGYFSSEGDARLTYSTPSPTLNVGPFKLRIQISGSTMRLSPESSSECRGRAPSMTAKFGLVVSPRSPLPQGFVPEGIRKVLPSAPQVFSWETTLIDNGPRLRPGIVGLSLRVEEGHTASIALNDHIEGGALTFAMGGSVPTDLEVTRNGGVWSVTAQEGAMGGAITVAATGENNVCRTFPLEITVAPATRLTVKPDYQEVISGSVAPGETYTSQPLGDYVIVRPAGEQLRFDPEEIRRTGEGWTHRIEDERLVVSSTSDMTSGDMINIRVSVTNADENAVVRLDFEVTVEGQQQPSGGGGQQPPGGSPTPGGGNAGAAVHCKAPGLDFTCTVYPVSFPSGECPGDWVKVTQCPIPGGSYVGTCRYQGGILTAYGGGDETARSTARSIARSICEGSGGVFTPL